MHVPRDQRRIECSERSDLRDTERVFLEAGRLLRLEAFLDQPTDAAEIALRELAKKRLVEWRSTGHEADAPRGQVGVMSIGGPSG